MGRSKEIFKKVLVRSLIIAVAAYCIRLLPEETRRGGTDAIRDVSAAAGVALNSDIDLSGLGFEEPVRLPKVVGQLAVAAGNIGIDIANFYFSGPDPSHDFSNGKVIAQQVEKPAPLSKDGLNKYADKSGQMPKVWTDAALKASSRVAQVLNGKYDMDIDPKSLAATITGVKETETANALVGVQFGKLQNNGSYYGLLYGTSGPALTNGENGSKAGGTCQFLKNTDIYMQKEMRIDGFGENEVTNGGDPRMDYRLCSLKMAYFFATKTQKINGKSVSCDAVKLNASQFIQCFARMSYTDIELMKRESFRSVWNAHDVQAGNARTSALKYFNSLFK